MGQIVNPGNAAFQRKALNGKIYVDKTGLLTITNEVIDTPDNLICNSRPRRFGKTVTANMLSAYYCRTCDSEKLFHGLEISKSPNFKTHLNQYDVIYWDMQWCIDLANGPENLLSYLTSVTIQELKEYYPDIKSSTVTGALSDIYQSTGRGFVVIIDEWDVLIRDYARDTQLVDSYISFLRGMFKGSGPDTYIHLAYMTGILPIKRTKTQSSLNNFKERTMLDPGILAPYIGFTEKEVQALCEAYHRDFQQVKRWYDGYLLDGYHVYNPVAVVSVLTERSGFKSYWSATGSYEAVDSAITINFDGLKTAIINMLAGEHVDVDVTRFNNDPTKFKSKDDVITYLIHLGYLGYDGKAFVPNEEIRQELSNAVSETKWADTKAHECIIEKYTPKEESEHITDFQRNQILTFHDIGVSDDNIAKGLSLPVKAVKAVLGKKNNDKQTNI